jgi:O-antigen/teichoic acid export membrane protein
LSQIVIESKSNNLSLPEKDDKEIAAKGPAANKSAYRQIMKATSIFGGVQVAEIVIQVIRSKFIAVLLGPIGMGIAGLLTTTINFIGVLSDFGLGTSAVKDIAAAHATGNENRIATVTTVLRRLVWITGILGTLITTVLSPWLSQLAFGNRDYTLAFIWISGTLLFAQLRSGQLVLLQGMRKIQYLAKANLYGSIIGLIVTVPLYYVLGLTGIVPGIIITSIIALTLSWIFVRKISIPAVKVTKARTIAEGKGMLTMGFTISLSVLLSVGASYIVRVFIGRTGNLADVGLYSAGFSIVTMYVAMIFNAMGTDFYPRLSSVAQDKEQCNRTINQQAEIAILILAPILIVFLIFIHWVVILLYSKKFIPINHMVLWAALGMFFKVVIWLVGFLFIVKGNIKVYFWNEFASTIYTLILNLVGYHFLGLTGLGISFFVSYLMAMTQAFVIAKIKFQFFFERSALLLFFYQFGLAVAAFLVVYNIDNFFKYLAGVVLIGISGFLSFKELDKRIALKVILSNFRRR